MESLVAFLKVATPLACLAMTAVYARLFSAEDERPYKRMAVGAMALALACHTLLLFSVAALYQRCPLATRGEGVLFAAWVLALLHIATGRFAGTTSLAVFTTLPVTIGVCASVFLMQSEFGFPPQYHSSYFIFHIVASLSAYICFCIAAILSGSYLILYRRLKNKQFDVTFRKIPPLDVLERLSAGWCLAGCLAMLVGAAIGRWWMWLELNKGIGAKVLPLYMVLAFFMAAVFGHRFLAFRGRRYAVSVLVGFITGVVILALQRFHGFYE